MAAERGEAVLHKSNLDDVLKRGFRLHLFSVRVPLTHLLFSGYSYKDTCYAIHFTADFQRLFGREKSAQLKSDSARSFRERVVKQRSET